MSKELLDAFKTGERFEAKNMADATRVRCLKEDNNSIFVFRKGCTRYGRRWSEEDFLLHYSVCPKKDPDTVWKRNIRRTIKCLEESGLWPDKLDFLNNLLLMSWDDREQMRKIENDIFIDKLKLCPASPDRTVIMQWNKKWKPYAEKYPFAFYTSKDGTTEVQSDYLDSLGDCRLKSMYFGSSNRHLKAEIESAIKQQIHYHAKARVSYDVSFEYEPKGQRAWYSEEYKNCGNGHYYLALNHSTAWFCEDD